MRILFDNVQFGSSSGPNAFGMKLACALSERGHVPVESYESPDVQLSFIQHTQCSIAPVVQRLDGIWFNSKQPWQQQNAPIRQTYSIAKAVIVQSHFDKRLVETFFGQHSNMSVIHNGADCVMIDSIEPLDVPSLNYVEHVWSCASSWRPHKRLGENIRYFLEHSGKNDCLVIAGSNPDAMVSHPRIFYAGELEYRRLLELYTATDYFIHLAYLDHCPNVVVDARAAGAHIICSSSGGTREIAGPDATVVEEDEWDFQPCELYKPPMLDFSRKVRNTRWDIPVDIRETAEHYENVIEGVII